jgi:hypothetical protein
MRSPRRGEVWVHVDRLDREDGRVMAIQWRGSKGGPYYQTAHKVEWRGVEYLATKFFGRRSKNEPRLVIVIPRGVVEMIELAPNMRVARIAIASPATSCVVDRKRRARE